MSYSLRVLVCVAVCFVVVGAACSSEGGDPNPTTTDSATSSTVAVPSPETTTASTIAIPTPETTTTTVSVPRCPNPHGGECLGVLDAGTYSTRSMHPEITYTVPAGWENIEDLPGNFLLQQRGDQRYLAVYQNVRIPAECNEEWADGVGESVDDLVAWYTAHPGIVSTEPETVSLGGLSGVSLDLSLDPAWTGTCDYSDGLPIVPILIGGLESSLHHVLLPGFQERLYLLEWSGGNMVIEVGPEGTDLLTYLDEVIPIVESMTFSS